METRRISSDHLEFGYLRFITSSSLIINGNPRSKRLTPSIAELVNFIHLVSWTCSYSSKNGKSVQPHSYPWLRRLRKQSSLFVVDMKYAFLK